MRFTTDSSDAVVLNVATSGKNALPVEDLQAGCLLRADTVKIGDGSALPLYAMPSESLVARGGSVVGSVAMGVCDRGRLEAGAQLGGPVRADVALEKRTVYTHRVQHRRK